MELADTLDSKPSARKSVKVQLLCGRPKSRRDGAIPSRCWVACNPGVGVSVIVSTRTFSILVAPHIASTSIEISDGKVQVLDGMRTASDDRKLSYSGPRYLVVSIGMQLDLISQGKRQISATTEIDTLGDYQVTKARSIRVGDCAAVRNSRRGGLKLRWEKSLTGASPVRRTKFGRVLSWD